MLTSVLKAWRVHPTFQRYGHQLRWKIYKKLHWTQNYYKNVFIKAIFCNIFSFQNLVIMDQTWQRNFWFSKIWFLSFEWFCFSMSLILIMFLSILYLSYNYNQTCNFQHPRCYSKWSGSRIESLFSISCSHRPSAHLFGQKFER